MIFGRIPRFDFLLHLPLIHLLAVIICFARYAHGHWMFESPTVSRFHMTPPPGWGFSLPIVYLIWVSVVIGFYPLCRWFAAVEQRHGTAWLSCF